MTDIKIYLYFVATLFLMLFAYYILYIKNERKNQFKRRLQAAIPLLQIREKTDDLFSSKNRYETLLQRKLEELLYKKTSVGSPINLKFYRCGLKKLSLERALIIFGILFLSILFVSTLLFNINFIYAIIIAFMATTFVCFTILSYLENKRKKLIAGQLSPAVEIIVRAIRSGSTIDKTFKTVVQEIDSPLKEEFYDILKGLEFGLSYENLMHIAAARINIPEFYFFTTALVIQRESGGSLADILDNIVIAINKSQELQMKVQSLSAEGQTTGYILGGLPVLILAVLWFVRPDHILFLFNDESGRTLLLVSGGLLSAGLFSIKRMIKIDI